MRRTKEDAEQTRKLILNTALRLFASKGIAACSLVEIAASAELTRGAIYWHFKNKTELLEAIVMDFAGPLIERENAILLETEGDPLGKLGELLTFLMTNIARDETFGHIVILCQRMRILRLDEEDTFSSFCSMLKELTMERRNRRIKQLENAKRKRQLPENIDVTAAADFLIGSIEGIASTWISDPDTYSLETMAKSYSAALIHGIKNIVNKS